jgi:hypothetical protein
MSVRWVVPRLADVGTRLEHGALPSTSTRNALEIGSRPLASASFG